MTEKQAEAEIRHRLAKFLLFRLQEENLLTPEESEKARQALCKKYKPFTYRRGRIPVNFRKCKVGPAKTVC